MRRIAIALGIVMDVVLAVVLYPRECLNVGGALVFGWVSFLWRTVPQAEVNWIGVATGVVFLVLLILVLHFSARWCYRAVAAEPSSPQRRWRFRWTLSMVLALLLMFVVGYSTIGLARHVGWVVSSKAPLFDVQEIRHYKVVW